MFSIDISVKFLEHVLESAVLERVVYRDSPQMFLLLIKFWNAMWNSVFRSITSTVKFPWPCSNVAMIIRHSEPGSGSTLFLLCWLCFAMFCYVLLCFAMCLLCFGYAYSMFCYDLGMLCYVFAMCLLWFAMLCYVFAMLCYVFAMFFYVLLCVCYVFTMCCYALLWFAMLCYVFAMFCYASAMICYVFAVFLICFAMFWTWQRLETNNGWKVLHSSKATAGQEKLEKNIATHCKTYQEHSKTWQNIPKT